MVEKFDEHGTIEILCLRSTDDDIDYIINKNGAWERISETETERGVIRIGVVGEFCDGRIPHAQFDGLVALSKVLMRRHGWSNGSLKISVPFDDQEMGNNFPLDQLRKRLDIPRISMWKNCDVAIVDGVPRRMSKKLIDRGVTTYAPIEWMCRMLGLDVKQMEGKFEIRDGRDTPERR